MIHPHTPLKNIVELFAKMGLRYCFVTRNGILQGMVTSYIRSLIVTPLVKVH
jgi:hypothetical protein